MALKLPSLQFDYHLVFSGDPALNLPDPSTAPEEEKAAVTKERERILAMCRETGCWQDYLFVGQLPTLFKLKSIHGEMSWIRSVASRDQLSADLFAELCFRCAVTGIENFGTLRVERFENADGIAMLTKGTVDAIKAIGIDSGLPLLGHTVIIEIGILAFNRATEGLPPKR